MKNSEISFRNKALKGFAWLSTGTFIGQSVSWISTLIVIRLLTPADYGLMAMAGSFIVLVAMFNDLGFNAAIIQKKEIEDIEVRQIFTLVLIAGIFGCILCFLAAPIVAWFYGEHRLVPLVRLMSLNFVLSALFLVPEALTVREMNFLVKARIDVIARVISAILTLVLAVLSLGVWALAFGETCFHIVRAIGFNVVRAGCLIPVTELKGSIGNLKFGLAITASRLFYFLFTQSDIIIAGKFLGKELLGIYAIALNLAMIPSEKVMPLITQVSFTAFSRIQDEIERIRKNFLKVLRTVGFITFPVFYGLYAIAPEGIATILSPKWESLISPFQLFCLIIPIRTLHYLFAPVLFAINKPMINVVNMAITFAIMTVAFLIGVNFSILGLCMVWVLIYPIVFTITSIRSLKAIAVPFKDFVSAIIFPFAASTLMLLTLSALRTYSVMGFSPVISLLIYMIIGATIYVCLVLVFKHDTVQELRALIRQR